jgi:beta-glucosidase
VSFTVTNTGGRGGADVVPVFVRQATSTVVVPPHRLVAFSRVDLQAGESRSLTIEFPASRLAVTPGDIDSSAAPRVEAGVYTLEVPDVAEANDLLPATSPPLTADFRIT